MRTRNASHMLLAAAITILASNISMAQVAQFGSRSTANSTGGRSGMGNSNLGASSSAGRSNTGSNSRSSGLGGLGSGSSSGASFGSGFSFDPTFGATPFGGSNTGNMSGMNRMGIGMGMGMGMGMGGFGMGGFGMNRSGMGGMGGNQQQRPKLRPTVSVDFEVDRPTNQQRLNQVQVNLSKLPQPGRFTGVNVQMVGSKAVVTGSLPNSKDADVLKQLLLLEPGIYEVDVRSLADSQSSGSDRRAAGSGQYDTESRSTVEVVPLPRPAR